MNKRFLVNTALVFSLFTASNLPVFASEIAPETTIENLENQATNENNSISVISVKIAEEEGDNITLDIKSKKRIPVVLNTFKSIKNNAGEEVIPKGSLIDGLIVPIDKGAMIIAESLIINGKPYKINASLKNIIPAQKVNKESDIDNGRNKVPKSSTNSIPNLNGGGGNSNLGTIFNAVDGFLRSRNRRSKLEAVISTNKIYILHFQKPLSLDRFPSTSNSEELGNSTESEAIPQTESEIPENSETNPTTESETPEDNEQTESQTPENNESTDSQTPQNQ